MTTACSGKNKDNTAGVHISILAKNSQYTDVDYESTEAVSYTHLRAHET